MNRWECNDFPYRYIKETVNEYCRVESEMSDTIMLQSSTESRITTKNKGVKKKKIRIIRKKILTKKNESIQSHDKLSYIEVET